MCNQLCPWNTQECSPACTNCRLLPYTSLTTTTCSRHCYCKCPLPKHTVLPETVARRPATETLTANSCPHCNWHQSSPLCQYITTLHNALILLQCVKQTKTRIEVKEVLQYWQHKEAQVKKNFLINWRKWCAIQLLHTAVLWQCTRLVRMKQSKRILATVCSQNT